LSRSFAISSQAKATSSEERSPSILWLSILGGLVVTTAGGVKYYLDHFGGTEGLQRSLSFYSFAIPKYLEYRYHLWRQSPDEEWKELDRVASQGALRKILELEGFYIKCGQMCAANIGNAFPPIWQDTMAVLQDEVPARDFSVIRETVESELDFEGTFASFEPKPIGSASIGQVHRAVLKDGTHVVVKVRYPDVERLLRGDVRTMTAFCEVAQPVHVPGLLEIEKQFQTEFDYREEAANLEAVRENLEKAGLCGKGKLCIVPKPYRKYCTKRVLVMEELNGDKLHVALKKDMQKYAELSGQTIEEFIAKQKATSQEKEEKGETLQGFSAREFDLLISVDDAKRRTKNAAKRVYNITLGWLPGSQWQNYTDKTELPLNQAKLVDDLIYIHGHEVLVDGCFNGDPHPGKCW
jgi:aarF domain-containing kinase